MEPEVHWREERASDVYRTPGPDQLGRWAVVALVLSVLLHVMVFFALDRIKIVMGIGNPEELTTAPIDIRRIEVKPYEPEAVAAEEETVVPPEETAPLMEEIDLLDLLPENVEVDISPEVVDPEYALKLTNPLAEGELEAPSVEISKTFDLESSLPDFGKMNEDVKPVALGQITVDPGSLDISEEDSSTAFTDDLIKKGNAGLVKHGSLDGVESLDDLLDLPPNLLLSKKTMLPSDLLFEFNRADLKESAKVGLMKLALLIDKNPGLHCWIEGHTDLIGGHESNLELSMRRAEAVKKYLVESMRMESKRIHTIGYGKTQPLISEGDANAQAGNRRVEIKMRKTAPDPSVLQNILKEKPKEVDSEKDKPAPPKAELVKPNRALPVPEQEVPRAETVPQQAEPVQEEVITREVPRAEAIPERAEPVEEEPPVLKAELVEP